MQQTRPQSRFKPTVEKVLYWASRPEELHLSHSERTRNTDLWQIVCKLLRDGSLTPTVTQDDSTWYTLTPIGQLLNLEFRHVYASKHNPKACAQIDEAAWKILDKHPELTDLVTLPPRRGLDKV